MVVCLHPVVSWAERRVWRKLEARVRHYDQIKATTGIQWEGLGNERTCNHLSGQVGWRAIVGTVVFLGDVDTGPNCHLATCMIIKCASQY